jgi:acetolactate synthase-1/2/3 large subunit
MGIGIYPSSDSNYLGMIGINGTYLANSALNKCDLLIALGVSFSERTTCKNEKFAKNSKIVNINIDIKDNDFELNIKSDIKEFLTKLVNVLNKNTDNLIWQKELAYIREENINEHHYDTAMDSPTVLRIISEYTSKYEPVVVTDVGQHQMLTAQFFTFNKSRKFITSGGMGTMGFGLPAAYGAQIANPHQLILNITGDGSFQMNLQELATCREHNIPIKIIILNNGSLGMVRQLQEKMYKNTYQVDMINPDFTKIAEAYDLYAIRVTKKSEIIPALDKIISHKGTAIMDIKIFSHEDI